MDYFKSGGPFKCTKGWGKASLQEGGIRLPFIITCGSHLTPGTSDYAGQFVDIMPTLAEIAGVKAPKNDGISLVPTMTGRKQPQHEYLYWEFPGGNGWLAVRCGEWKGLVRDVHKGNSDMELYNLKTDSLETTNLAAEHPGIVEKMWGYIQESHVKVPNDVKKYQLEITYPEKK